MVLVDIIENEHDTNGILPPTPPPGFTREIMDALDNAVRYRDMYN